MGSKSCDMDLTLYSGPLFLHNRIWHHLNPLFSPETKNSTALIQLKVASFLSSLEMITRIWSFSTPVCLHLEASVQNVVLIQFTGFRCRCGSHTVCQYTVAVLA